MVRIFSDGALYNKECSIRKIKAKINNFVSRNLHTTVFICLVYSICIYKCVLDLNISDYKFMVLLWVDVTTYIFLDVLSHCTILKQNELSFGTIGREICYRVLFLVNKLYVDNFFKTLVLGFWFGIL